MTKNGFENPAEFQSDIAQILQAIKEKGETGAAPLVNEFKQKYGVPATITKGAECAGCSVCVTCFDCGPTLFASMHVGHSMYVWAFNG